MTEGLKEREWERVQREREAEGGLAVGNKDKCE